MKPQQIYGIPKRYKPLFSRTRLRSEVNLNVFGTIDETRIWNRGYRTVFEFRK